MIVDYIENRVVGKINEMTHLYGDFDDVCFKHFSLLKTSAHDLLIVIYNILGLRYDTYAYFKFF